LPPFPACGRILPKKGELFMEWVTFGIAVLGFVMSSLSWLRELWLRRNRIELTVIDYAHVHNNTQFYLSLCNKSTLPASIAKISVKLDGTWYDCKLEPQLIKQISSYTAMTPCFPIDVPPLAYFSFYIELPTGKDIPLVRGKELSFQIHTSRGILMRSQTLGDTAHYLHIA